ncbi:hypothetical protein SY2F82_10090 [Streptomyces sp. Y2F8-2]|nr:hypothetical protein SY2F82_10090 [Streptomyces sp. Y2F8-2]
MRLHIYQKCAGGIAGPPVPTPFRATPCTPFTRSGHTPKEILRTRVVVPRRLPCGWFRRAPGPGGSASAAAWPPAPLAPAPADDG